MDLNDESLTGIEARDQHLALGGKPHNACDAGPTHATPGQRVDGGHWRVARRMRATNRDRSNAERLCHPERSAANASAPTTTDRSASSARTMTLAVAFGPNAAACAALATAAT